MAMKTAEECLSEFTVLNRQINSKWSPLTQAEMDNHKDRLREFFKAIQLDAGICFMETAAEIIRNHKHTNNEHGAKVHGAILSAITKLKEEKGYKQ